MQESACQERFRSRASSVRNCIFCAGASRTHDGVTCRLRGTRNDAWAIRFRWVRAEMDSVSCFQFRNAHLHTQASHSTKATKLELHAQTFGRNTEVSADRYMRCAYKALATNPKAWLNCSEAGCHYTLHLLLYVHRPTSKADPPKYDYSATQCFRYLRKLFQVNEKPESCMPRVYKLWTGLYVPQPTNLKPEASAVQPERLHSDRYLSAGLG